MTDRHIRVLRVIARHRQHQLDNHVAANGVPDATSAERRQDLERVAARTRARLNAAQARRRQMANA